MVTSATPSTPAVASAFDGARLHVVTGKGGTGKTTVAASMALALAHSGKKVLLCEVEGRQACARLFDCPPLDYTERPVLAARNGGSVLAMAVEPRAALMDYLDTFYVLGGRAGKVLDSLGAVDFATTVAPGLRDVLLTGKVYEAAKRMTKGRRGVPSRRVFDAVVVDAPPTGRITRFLNVSTQVSGLAKVGPIHAQAESMQAMMHAPSTRVHLVCLPEDMPVQETCEGVAELQGEGFLVGAVCVNRVLPEHVSAGQVQVLADGGAAEAVVAQELVAAGAAAEGELADRVSAALCAGGRDFVARAVREEEQVDRLVGLGRPLVRVPWVPGGVNRAVVARLADELSAQGVA